MELTGIMVSILGCDKHVPEVERFIRTVKVRVQRSTYSTIRKIPTSTVSRNRLQRSNHLQRSIFLNDHHNNTEQVKGVHNTNKHGQ